MSSGQSRLTSADFLEFQRASILPVVSTIHEFDSAEHDNVGFARFVDFWAFRTRSYFVKLATAISGCKHRTVRNQVRHQQMQTACLGTSTT
jgi:hypothetical protein